MRIPILFLVIIAAVNAGTYRGKQSVKAGKKRYNCVFSIAYTTSPPACGKKTVKCKPIPKKPIKFPTIKTGDATIAASVAKNKIKFCKVVPKPTPAPTTTPVPKVTPAPTTTPAPGGGGAGAGGGTGGGNGGTGGGGGGGGASEQMNCNCRMPMMEQPPAVRTLGASVTRMLINTNPKTGFAKGRLAVGLPKTDSFIAKERQAAERGGGHGHGHIPRPPQNVNPTTPTFTDLIPLLAIALIAGFVGAIKGELVANLLGLRNLEPVDEVAEREREQARILSKLEDRLDITGLLGLLGNNGGGGGANNGLGGILGGILGNGNNGGANGFNGGFGDWGDNLGANGGFGEWIDNSGANGGFGGFGDGFGGGFGDGIWDDIWGANGGGSNNAVGNAVMQAILLNTINQIIENPTSLQEMINIAVNNGLAEQAITDLIESGDIDALVQSLMESGAAPDIISNLGNGIVQNLINSNEIGNMNVDNLSAKLTQILENSLSKMEPGSLESVLAGVDVQNMELNMQCSCTKEEPIDFPVPGK